MLQRDIFLHCRGLPDTQSYGSLYFADLVPPHLPILSHAQRVRRDETTTGHFEYLATRDLQVYGIREIRKELTPVKPITTKELDYAKLELLIRAGYAQEKIAEKIDYSSVRLVALCKKYWDKTPQELRFEWADSTYEMLLKAKTVEEAAPSTPVPPTPQMSAATTAGSPQFADKEYPCARCFKTMHLTAERQQETWAKYGAKASLPKLCRTCKGLMDGKFWRVFPNQLHEGDRVIDCACGHQILFTRKQQDEFLMKGWPEPKHCRECRSRSGSGDKAYATPSTISVSYTL